MDMFFKGLILIVGLFTRIQSVIINFKDEPHYAVDGDTIIDESNQDAKPGTPRLRKTDGAPLFDPQLFWRADLGQRLIRVANAREAMDHCGSFISFGDFSWCRKAMPEEFLPSFKTSYRSVHEYVVSKESVSWKPTVKPEALLGLSYGIEAMDSWSELMSSLYLVKTRLYDCFYDEDNGPIANDWHAGYSKEKPCDSRFCYSAEYEAKRVCLDDSTGARETFTGENQKQYEPLGVALAGRGPLSTFLKMDIEGSEWQSLVWLLSNEENLMKIRTLDMEVHFNMEATPEGQKELTQEILTNHVAILEKLTDKFAVTGSTLETHLAKAAKHQLLYHNDRSVIYTTEGLPLDQFCISFVNKQLLY